MPPFFLPFTQAPSSPFFPPGYPPPSLTSLLSSHADKLKLSRYSPYPAFPSSAGTNHHTPPHYVSANIKSAFEAVRPANHNTSPSPTITPPSASSPINFSNQHNHQSNSISEIKNIENMIRCLNGSEASERSGQFGISHDNKSDLICKEEN